ncbi:MAG: C25 family cysteine peptidase, partial [Anaerolineales bacterium]|nr:C25 family cysteine peptidase [Anaerolineales bacterium]
MDKRSETRLKLLVSADGLYRVTAADLKNAGANTSQLDAATLQLFRGARPIPIRVRGAGADLAFEFYGQASDSPYSNFSVYWVTWGQQSAAPMRETRATATRGAPQTSVSSAVHFAPPIIYLPQFGEDGAPWFWQTLIAPMTTTITVTLPSAIAAPAQMQVHLWGSTQDAANPDHHLRAFFNDARIADEKWDGQGARSITTTIPANAVRVGENTLRLITPGDTGAQADIVLLRSIDANYTRRLLAQNDQIEFTAGAGTYRIEGFSGDAIDLFDITDPFAPSRVTNLSITARALTFANDAPSPRRWLAVGPNAAKPVAQIVAMSDADLRAPERAADYLIVTHASRDFVDALQPLVQWREQNGLRVRVVTTTQVYDEFGYGEESPHALRAFLDWARQNWQSPALRFVLLVGKASYDYRDYQKGANKNLLPTFLLKTPHLGQAASDNWFVAPDDQTGHPVLAIGRIPAQTAEQVTRVVNKIIAYESSLSARAEWHRRALFIADDKEPQFVSMSDALIAQLPSGVVAQKTYLADHRGDVNAARSAMLARWNEGARWLAYIGHGSIDTWAEGPLFSVEHLGALKNGARTPILFTPTCLDGFFYHPQKNSLAEELLFKSD